MREVSDEEKSIILCINQETLSEGGCSSWEIYSYQKKKRRH